VTGQVLDDQGPDPARGLGILFSTITLEPTSSPLQWLSVFYSPRAKMAGSWNWPFTSI